MAMYQVFVEGPVEPTPAALHKLAQAMEQRYKLAAAELVARMSKGRFRVKSNLDRATAEAYVRDLTAIGARAVMEELSAPGRRAPAAPAAPPAFASGLSAAFSGDMPAASLGALDNAELTLSSLDGADAGSSEPQFSAAPAPPSAPAPVAPTAQPVAAARPTISDRFAPPEQQGVPEAALELQPEERPRPTPTPSGHTSPVLRPSRPVIPVPGVTFAPTSLVARSTPRWRLVAGVVLAIVLGFVPAHIVSVMREHSAYRVIDRDLTAAQNAAITPDDWDQLDGLRNAALEKKRDARRSIALTSMLLWAAAAGLLAYVWFLRIAWDRDPRDATG